MRLDRRHGAIALAICACALVAMRGYAAPAASYTLFESDPVRPLALSPNGQRLYALNIPDGYLEIFRVGEGGVTHQASVAVGVEPVAVAARSDSEVWVVNHLSDSVSIVDVAAAQPHVVRTLWVGDEPRDIVFAGANRERAFVTTAHRGQHALTSPRLDRPGLGRADVWVFAADALGSSPAGEPLTVISLFGDTPRALATSPDGGTVYAAVFKSGNQTTTVSAFAVCEGGETAPPCEVAGKSMPGGLPGPNMSIDGVAQPRTGLIVKYDRERGAWMDPIDRDWSNAVPIALPDKDVFAIDALADPPVETAAYSGIGTIIYAMATNPLSGRLYVANSEARNEVRFEPNLRSHLHETRVSVIDGGAVHVRHLNKHIDYASAPSPADTKARSLAIANAIAVSSDGSSVWIAGFGSGRIAQFSTAELEDDTFIPSAERFITVSGGGPAGLVLDELRQRAYVLTRFDNGIAVVDLAARREVDHLTLHNPEPASVREGRPFMYDADYTSSNGEAACASCHVFADNDALAWDLGDPNQPAVANPNPQNPLRNVDPRLGTFFNDFHPLKGPLTTQSLRGLAHHSPMHWRGDRTGAFDSGGSAYDDRAAFAQFNGAFVALMGRAAPLTSAEMEAFTSFVMQITPPPNPIRNLDNSLSEAQQISRNEFFRPILDISCASCHVTTAAEGRFGSDRSSSVNGQSAQLMKVPSLRQTYQKVGMFGMFPQLEGFMNSGSGDQVRGYGFLHDGATGVFIRRTFDYVMAFDTNLAPIVGQQVTLSTTNAALAGASVDLLMERAAAGECDLTVKGVIAGELRGWVRTAAGDFQSDVAAQATLTDDELRALAGVGGQELTYTCNPPGSGARVGIDRDGDGFFDTDERRAGSDESDGTSVPPATATVTPTPTVPPTSTPTKLPCAGDCDGGQSVPLAELLAVIAIGFEEVDAIACAAADANRDSKVTIEDMIRAVNAANHGC